MGVRQRRCNKQDATWVVVGVVVISAMIGAAEQEEPRKLFSLKQVFNPKTRVQIVNKLGTWDTVTVHCKSGNNDIGTHPIVANGSYSFSFHRSVWGNTLFHCSVTWPGNSHSFDIYKDQRDYLACGTQCCWKIRPKGGMRCNHVNRVFTWKKT